MLIVTIKPTCRSTKVYFLCVVYVQSSLLLRVVGNNMLTLNIVDSNKVPRVCENFYCLVGCRPVGLADFLDPKD